MAVRVSWKPPASDHGSPITRYQVLGHWPGWMQAAVGCTSTTTSCIVRSAPGRPMVFTVQAWNAGGWSPATDPITVAPYGPPASACAAKSSVEFHGPTAHLTWACADDGFGTTTSYAVHLTSASWKTYDYTTTSPQLAVVGLGDATTYTVQIAPLNSVGGAPYTFAGSFRIPDLGLRPARMSEPSASGIHRDSATVSWHGAIVKAGTPVSRYEVRVLSGSTVVETLNIAPSARSVHLVKLKAHTRYTVLVRARNFAGAPSWSPAHTLRTSP
jgi:hypothetical protein